MKRFILTGAPGAGKTVLLRQLELDGYSVVEEAATGLIALWQARGTAEPWTQPAFIDQVAELQRQRLIHTPSGDLHVQFHDRSIFCTEALANYLGHPISDFMAQELARIKREKFFQQRVIFVRSLGFVTPTEARRISLQDALRFERIHEEIYRHFGFELVFIESGSLPDRIAAIKKFVETDSPA